VIVCLVGVRRSKSVQHGLGLGTSGDRRLGIKVYWELERASAAL